MIVYEKLLEANSEGKNTVIVTVVEKKGHGPAKVGFKMLVSEEGRIAGTVGGGELEHLAIERAKNVLKEQNSFIHKYFLDDSDRVDESVSSENTKMLCGGTISLYFEYNGARDVLYLFGVGHVGQALLYHLKKLTYEVILIDDREKLLEKFRDYKTYKSLEELKRERDVHKNSFFIIATYSHDVDYKALKSVIEEDCKPRYIGIIASKKKSETILTKIKKEFSDNSELLKIHSPIGLNIGGNTADEIAISILAELQSVKYCREDFKW